MWGREKRESWKGGDDDWPDRRLRWFRDRVAVLVTEMMPDKNNWTNKHRLEALLTLCESPGRFACKVAEEEYRGNRFSAWTWQIQRPLVLAAVQEMTDEFNKRTVRRNVEIRDRAAAKQRRLEAEQYPTLDAWLEAEAHGKIQAPAPEEPTELRRLLSRESSRPLREYLKKHEARLRRWPRLCRDCGSEFTGRINAVRCAKCRGHGAKKSNREGV